MIKKLLALASIVVVLNSCSKSDDSPAGCTYTANTTVAPSSEITTLQAYASTNYPTAIQHSSGMFYEISAPGTGTVVAQPCSKIKVSYSRYSIPGNVKLEENTTTFTLGGLIAAWQQGIPLIKTGGSMMLLVPPSLAYNDGNYHKFLIQLLEIQ